MGVTCDCITLGVESLNHCSWLQVLAAAPAPAPHVVKASAVESTSAATQTEMKDRLAHHQLVGGFDHQQEEVALLLVVHPTLAHRHCCLLRASQGRVQVSTVWR
jgi:cell fate (sporulation/competence/biofilm development) regulator YmcA (YheA/YmcA/DUF963 family)